MRRVAVLQHHPEEGPGTLEPLLTSCGVTLEILRLDLGVPVPVDPNPYVALVIMGGPMSVHDEPQFPWLVGEKRLIRQAAAAGVPILGHCLGAQLLTAALGGEVERNPNGQELGWWPVHTTPAGKAYWQSREETWELFHWHGEHCTRLPAGAEVLLTNGATPVQAFRLGTSILGIQAHPELTAVQVRSWVHSAAWTSAGPFQQSPAEMLARLEERTEKLAQTASFLYGPWLAQWAKESS